MEEFKKKFIEDAKELVNKLEQDLLFLDKQGAEKKVIESVFRGMHTLKGTAGMYGFDKIGELTHALENVYDEIRSEKLILDKEILHNSFSGVDLINYLLNSNDKLNSELDKEFKHILDFSSMESLDNYTSAPSLESTNSTRSKNLYYILFEPSIETFKRGVNLEATLEEFNDIGAYYLKVNKESIPRVSEIDPTEFYLKWEILVVAEVKENIEDIFMFFLEDEFTILEIETTQKLSQNKSLKSLLSVLYSKDNIQNHLNELSEIVSKIYKSETPTAEDLNLDEQKRKKSFNLVNQFLNKASTQDTVRVPSSKLDDLMNLVSELVIMGSRLELKNEINDFTEMDEMVEDLNKISRNFRDIVLNIRLVPLNTIMVRLNRLVHDLANDLGKNINFVVEGADTELDKTIINNLEGPLMHIIRNSIDHGIETVEERKQKGKKEEGIVRFIAFYSGTNVFIQVQDDGKGIDTDMIRKIAIKKGFIDASDKLSKKEIYSLIFLPGFTTSEKVTEISGRGVGMDVVRQNIADLRGEIEIDSEIDLGTSVTLKLPLTLSIIDSLLVEVNKQPYIIPQSFINSCEIISEEKKITKIQNNYEHNGKLIPLIRLADVLKLDYSAEVNSRIIVIQYSEKFYALEVDKIIGEHQAVIKPLGALFENSKLFSGATILGDGNLAFILDIINLVKSD